MSDLVISSLIRMILIALVIAACVTLLGLFFKSQVIGFFKGFTLGGSSGAFWTLLR